jgi:type II secretory ATPase GspE/PulE/Tfp pilus assembly ATPase PilB-like protein
MSSSSDQFPEIREKGLQTSSSGTSFSWRGLALCSSREARAIIPLSTARQYTILPLSIRYIEGTPELVIATSETSNELELRSALKLITNHYIYCTKVDSSLIEKAIISAYRSEHSVRTLEQFHESKNQNHEPAYSKRISVDLGAELSSDIPKLLQAILTLAFTNNASDIHIESLDQDKTRTSFRMDGILRVQDKITLNGRIFDRVVQHLKVIAGLDITEHFSPQDGMFEFVIGTQKIRVRISIIPNLFGVKLAARLLYHPLLDDLKDRNANSLDLLGLSHTQKEIFTHILHRKGGLVLLSGPTGSGKSTLLYGLISDAAKNKDKNIISMEDPVERNMEEITQIEISSHEKMSYHSVFKSLLRQDPDMIILSEIRDKEALQIAIQASLSGTLVLSTIHASNVIELVLRLFELESSPISLGASLKIISSQRLLRRNCPACSERVVAEDRLYEKLSIIKSKPLKRALGCRLCSHTGTQGRVAVYETCEPTLSLISELSLLYASGLKNVSQKDLETYLVQSNYIPFSYSIKNLLLSGEISPETALSVLF